MRERELASLVERLNAEPQLDYTLDQVVEQARVNVPGCEFGAVSLLQRGEIVHSCATDPLAEELGTLQIELGQGPCFELSWDHEILRVEDFAVETRWPRWASAVRAAGIGSSLTILVPVGGQSGMLTMYSRQTGAFDQASIDLAAVYARLSGVALRHAYHSDGLRTAMQNRLAIGVAQGILMQRYGIPLDRSFEVLRRRSNETNTKLRDVALSIVYQTDPGALDSLGLEGGEDPRPRDPVPPPAGHEQGARPVPAAQPASS